MYEDFTLRWHDLPLCHCGLRHWPEELELRHTVSLVAGSGDDRLWVSGDAPDPPGDTTAHTLHLAELGIRHIVDVRAEAAELSQWDQNVMAAHDIEYTHLGVVDHHDAFVDAESLLTWSRRIGSLPEVPTLIHCHMGVNRSASAAVLLLVARGATVADAVRSVLSRRTAMAIYAPAVLAARFGEEHGAEAQAHIEELRAADRRSRDAW